MTFTLATATAIILGVWFKSSANSGEPSASWSHAPEQIAIYVSNPSTRIGAELETTWSVANSNVIKFVLNVSAVPPEGKAKDQFALVIMKGPARPQGDPKGDPGYAFFHYRNMYIADIPVSFWSGAYNSLLQTATFSLPRGDVYQSTKTSVYGHLPAFDYFPSGAGYPYTIFATVISPHAFTSHQKTTSEYRVTKLSSGFSPSDPNVRGFLPPISRTDTVDMINFVRQLRTSPITSQVPNGFSEGNDYIWSERTNEPTSNATLDTSFVSTDPIMQDKLSNAAFYSGIAFGVAGAAGIGIAQELPKNFSISSWARRGTGRIRNVLRRARLKIRLRAIRDSFAIARLKVSAKLAKYRKRDVSS